MFDVAIVGSGPAGATCATFCPRAGLRTLLLEREKFPREKVCGDCLNPSCTPVLERLGVAQRVRQLPHGQKVGTTNAQFAAYGLLLARTDADVPKHKGLTMFIVPMNADGVTTRGLRQISGEAEFNEVFFDDVKLGAENVVGGVGNGWGTALTTLMFERLTIGAGSEAMRYRADPFTKAIAADEHARRDPEIRKRLGELASELIALRFLGYRTLTALQKGQIPGPESALAKITTVNAAITATDMIADVIGPDALDDERSEWAYAISFLPGLKSAGGTEEILRNTVGERVLGLPPEPRLDKGIPFSELRAKEREEAAAR